MTASSREGGLHLGEYFIVSALADRYIDAYCIVSLLADGFIDELLNQVRSNEWWFLRGIATC